MWALSLGLEELRKSLLDTNKRGYPREMLGHVVHVPRLRRSDPDLTCAVRLPMCAHHEGKWFSVF